MRTSWHQNTYRPTTVTVFLDHYCQARDNEELYLELGDGSIKFSARWLMHQLIMYLQPYMSYKCVVNRLGTLLYPRNGDMLKSLSLALHDCHSDSSVHEDNPALQLPNCQSNVASVLWEAGSILNDIIQNEIRRLKEHSTDLTNFSLMVGLCLCTRSVREHTQ